MPDPEQALASTSPAPAGLSLVGLGSMATRALLAELASLFESRSGNRLQLQAMGGVDAARKVQEGAVFDLVFLAADALDKLLAAGQLRAGSRVDLACSPVAVAVRAGAAAPDISTEAALKAAVLAAGSISFSTGPSGAHLNRVLQQWGVAEALAPRMVQTPPGVPVGSLIAQGQVELGFQQLSELMHLPGIRVLGLLPGATAFVTTFSAAQGLAVQPGSQRHAVLMEVLHFFNSAEAAEVKRRHGMEPA